MSPAPHALPKDLFQKAKRRKNGSGKRLNGGPSTPRKGPPGPGMVNVATSVTSAGNYRQFAKTYLLITGCEG